MFVSDNAYARAIMNKLGVATRPATSQYSLESLPSQSGATPSPGQGAYFPVTGAQGPQASDNTIKYPDMYGTTGPFDVWAQQNAGPWNFFENPAMYAKNAGQTDMFNNTYVPVQAGLWTGGDVRGQFPGRSSTNAQLWGGATSDSPPSWLQQIVLDAMKMSGDARTARFQHIMDSLLTPGSGANSHDVGYVERMMGLI